MLTGQAITFPSGDHEGGSTPFGPILTASFAWVVTNVRSPEPSMLAITIEAVPGLKRIKAICLLSGGREFCQLYAFKGNSGIPQPKDRGADGNQRAAQCESHPKPVLRARRRTLGNLKSDPLRREVDDSLISVRAMSAHFMRILLEILFIAQARAGFLFD